MQKNQHFHKTFSALSMLIFFNYCNLNSNSQTKFKRKISGDILNIEDITRNYYLGIITFNTCLFHQGFSCNLGSVIHFLNHNIHTLEWS